MNLFNRYGRPSLTGSIIKLTIEDRLTPSSLVFWGAHPNSICCIFNA